MNKPLCPNEPEKYRLVVIAYIYPLFIYIYPLIILFINALHGMNVQMALEEIRRQFLTLEGGFINWGLVLTLDLLIGLYAEPVILIHKLKLKGLKPSQTQMDNAVRRLNHLPKKLVGLTVSLFIIASILRVIIDYHNLRGISAHALSKAFTVNIVEALASGFLVGVILAINFDNILFRARSTLVELNNDLLMGYSSMYAKVFMAIFAIVAYVIYTTFVSMGTFFSIGLRNPGVFSEQAPLIFTGPQLIFLGDTFKGMKDAAHLFGIKIVCIGMIVLNVILQIKQMFNQPIQTVHCHLKLINDPEATKTAEIEILQNDEFAPIYREINKLILRQQSRIDLSEKRLLGVIQDAPDPIVVFDRDRIIRLFNPAAERLFEYKAADIIGQNLRILLPGSEGDLLSAHVDGVAKLEWSCQYGQKMYMESHISNAALGSDDWFIAILRDVTAQMELQHTLDRARQDAETASRMKSQFLTNMSHELRTPLNAILGFTQLLQHDKNLTDPQRERIRIISRSGEHLLSLINDILDIAKIEAGKMEVHSEVFDLHEFIEDLKDMFSLKCQAKALALYVDTLDNLPHYVRGDLGKLRQIMINLLGNAVKFTDEGGISILVGRQQGLIRFAVQDSGRGIPEDEHEKILQPFVQASTNDHEGGTGLGMAITSQYISLMGGRLELTSAPGKGSTFTFSLDLPEAEESGCPCTEENILIAVDPELGLSALVVDDQETNRLVLKEMLERVGFRILEASNGKEAVEQALGNTPSIILMDIKMPVLDGYAAVAKLKEEAETRQIPVFALTASAFTHDEKKIRNAGFDGFLAKPFKAGALYRLILESGSLPVQLVSDHAKQDDELRDIPAPEQLDPQRLQSMLGTDGIAELKEHSSIGDFAALLDMARRFESQWPEFSRLLDRAARSFDEQTIGRLVDRLEIQA